MNSDNHGETPAQTPPPNPGSADAPVFVSSSGEYLRLMLPVLSHLMRCFKYSGYLFCLGFAVLYALVFAAAGVLFPQTYQAWLDFCMPFAEYVGGLTPRADETARQLIENGYAERVDDALHGTAMAKVLIVAAHVCMLVQLLFSARPSPVFVSCTRQTYIKIWLRLSIACLLMLFIGLLAVYAVEFYNIENFGEPKVGRGMRIDDYHRGNFAMVIDVMGLWLAAIVGITPLIVAKAHLRFAHCTIVKHPPENKVNAP